MAFTIFDPRLFKLVLFEKRESDNAVRFVCLSLPDCVGGIDCRNCVHHLRVVAKFIKRASALALPQKRLANISVGPGKSSLPGIVAWIELREPAKYLLARAIF